MENMPRIVRKAVALSLLLAVVAVGYFLVVAPIEARISSAVDRIAIGKSLLARFDTAALKSRAEAAAPSLAGVEGDLLFLEGESDAVMSARLQAVLRAATAQTDGLRISTTRSLPPRETGDLRLVVLEVRFATTLAGVQRTLLALDRARPLVLVDTVQIVSAAQRASGDEASLADSFDVRMEIAGAAAPRRHSGGTGGVMTEGAGSTRPAQAATPSDPRPMGRADADGR